MEKDICSFETVYWNIVEAFFKRKAPEANANFCVFEIQCPKIMVLSKALNAKLSSTPIGVTSLSTPGLNRGRKPLSLWGLRLTTRRGNAPARVRAC